jgi:3-oxoacyl-[acyl-carrier protein] reductase
MRVADKIAVVTGAGAGIGRETCLLLAEEGATVVALDLSGEACLDVIGEIGGGLALACDVADRARVDEVFAEIRGAYARVDVLVNVAGVDRVPGDGVERWHEGSLAQMGQIAAGQPVTAHIDQLLNMTDEGWRGLMSVNLDGLFYCTRAALRIMVDAGVAGSIVNMSSISGLSGFGSTHYCASKAGVLGFTRGLAREVASRGIRVNAVCPGVIDTRMSRAAPPAFAAAAVAGTPLGRMGTPREVAAAVLHLASDESAYTTGQWLSPNGGFVMS